MIRLNGSFNVLLNLIRGLFLFFAPVFSIYKVLQTYFAISINAPDQQCQNGVRSMLISSFEIKKSQVVRPGKQGGIDFIKNLNWFICLRFKFGKKYYYI